MLGVSLPGVTPCLSAGLPLPQAWPISLQIALIVVGNGRVAVTVLGKRRAVVITSRYCLRPTSAMRHQRPLQPHDLSAPTMSQGRKVAKLPPKNGQTDVDSMTSDAAEFHPSFGVPIPKGGGRGIQCLRNEQVRTKTSSVWKVRRAPVRRYPRPYGGNACIDRGTQRYAGDEKTANT